VERLLEPRDSVRRGHLGGPQRPVVAIASVGVAAPGVNHHYLTAVLFDFRFCVAPRDCAQATVASLSMMLG
jgi:hypothetical protein